MKRMRKSKPTMAFYAMDAGCQSLYVKPGETWPQLAARADIPLVPLGACPNVPSPCGHCWYCEQRWAFLLSGMVGLAYHLPRPR